MTWFEAIIVAIVEGLTEFLPVSSTGHMIVTQGLLGVHSDEFVKAFTVIIQFGAILSVVVLYFKRFVQVAPVSVFRVPDGNDWSVWQKICYFGRQFTLKYDFYWKLLIAFLPAAVLGFLFSDAIDSLLERVEVVAIMLIVGGVFMIFVDKIFHKTDTDQSVSWQKALFIGFYQCVAMIPGVSRSMATIVGGMSRRLTRQNAAEFSFFLAVPTMFAASAWKLYKLLESPASRQLLVENLDILIIGNVVAFCVAIAAIKFFIGFLTRYGFRAFGYYRIAVGAILLILLLSNININLSVV